MELSHSELEKYHYAALKHPQYVAEGMLDLLREEMSMYLPYHDYEIDNTSYPIDTTRIQPDNRELIEQNHRLQVLVGDLQARLNRHIDAAKKRKGEY